MLSAKPPTNDDGTRPSSGDASTGARSRPLYLTRPREFYLLWFVATLTYGVGDIATTSVAVYAVPGLVESNPVLAPIQGQFGLLGFLAIKLAIFLVMLAISVRGTRADDRLAYYWPPVATAVVGAVLTVWNFHLISTAW